MSAKKPLAVVIGQWNSNRAFPVISLFLDRCRTRSRRILGEKVKSFAKRNSSPFRHWRFAAGGYAVGLIARSENSLKPVEQELQKQGHTGDSFLCLPSLSFFLNVKNSFVAVSVAADASNVASLKSAFETIRKKFGQDPEVLLYNASGFQYGKRTRDVRSRSPPSFF